jgi:hypothetical protein
MRGAIKSVLYVHVRETYNSALDWYEYKIIEMANMMMNEKNKWLFF